MRFSRRLLALVWFASLVFGSSGLARGAGAPVRLVAPAAGATLAAGSMAELEWEPLAGLGGVEEWEAFLSLDGGRSYPVRITPHLDQDLRRVRWQVPAIPTKNARILLRLGDEHRETAVELPARFSIAAPPRTAAGFPGTALLLSRTASGPGEPALPGQSGVVAWVEGSRRGGSLCQVIAEGRPGWAVRYTIPTSHAEAAEVDSGPVSPDSSHIVGSASSIFIPETPRRVALRAGAGPGLSFDILLQTQRQNE